MRVVSVFATRLDENLPRKAGICTLNVCTEFIWSVLVEFADVSGRIEYCVSKVASSVEALLNTEFQLSH